MNENKEIKKLSETGEQSAEKVAGGKDVKSLIPDERTLNRLNDKFCDPPAALHVYGRRCSDCGKRCSSICIFNGKEYCDSCWRKHAKESQNTSEKPVLGEESLSENDLSQVSGGINKKILENICKYKDHEYTCRLCGKTFIRRDPTGAGVAMRPRPVEEMVYCDKCLSKIRDTFYKS